MSPRRRTASRPLSVPGHNPPDNRETFESEERVRTYLASTGLTPAEEALFDRWIPDDADVLDLGVGAGRTVPALQGRAGRYVGVDYSQAMVRATSHQFPDVEFVEADAADLSRFGVGSFDVVVFSYNGLDYLAPHDRRERALAEIHRVLRPSGVFIMSTHNPRALVRMPEPSARFRPRALASAAVMTGRAVAARGLASATIRGEGYARDHVQGLHTYFATAQCLVSELSAAGFSAVDLAGSDHPRPIHSLTTAWTYVAAVRTDPELTISAEPFPEDGSALATAWDRLARDCSNGPFQSRAWISAWRAAFEPNAPIVTLVGRRDGTVVGLLPIARLSRAIHRRIPIRLRYTGLAGSGAGAADHLGPLANSEDVAAALFQALAARTAHSTVLLESLHPRWGAVARAATGARLIRTTPCPVNVRSEGGSFSDGWSAKTRKNARRRARMMTDAGITTHWTGPGADFAQALRELRNLHSDRWVSQGQAGLFPEEREAMLTELALRSTPEEGPWILTLRSGETPVAAMLGLRSPDRFSVYKTGWSPPFARMGPGIALGQEAMRWSESHGLHTFDYLRGAGSHKAELGCVPVADENLLRPVGGSGSVLSLREGRLSGTIGRLRDLLPKLTR